jgi:enoyl-CoA hydratase/carnithine racemase
VQVVSSRRSPFHDTREVDAQHIGICRFGGQPGQVVVVERIDSGIRHPQEEGVTRGRDRQLMDGRSLPEALDSERAYGSTLVMINAPAPVTVARNDGLAVVTVDSPPLNLFDMAMRDALVATVGELERTLPRAVLFRFEGKVVTGGVDVHVFDAISDAEEATALFAGLVATAQRVAALPCPTVFAAHGLCLTWGFELALACDLILASERARFGLIEATVGLTPAMGGTQRLAERAGSGRARELVMSADRYDATTLHQWGVVNRVLPADGFDAAARQVGGDLAEGPTRAHAATKDVISAYLSGGVQQADAQAPTIAGELFATQDLRSAMHTFLTEGHGRATFHGR